MGTRQLRWSNSATKLDFGRANLLAVFSPGEKEGGGVKFSRTENTSAIQQCDLSLAGYQHSISGFYHWMPLGHPGCVSTG